MKLRPARFRIACFAALALALGAAAGAPSAPARTPESLRGTPADPRPGTFLSADGARSVWVTLQELDPAQEFGVAREVESGRALAFRLLPYTSFRRFGTAGAEASEFSPGERVLLRLRELPAGPKAVPYALSLSDEISEQLREGRVYRVQSQDRANYRFTVEAFAPPPAEPQSVTLAYGPETTLVLREAANHTFNVPPGTVLRINTGTRPDGTRVAREVLDEASAMRFRKQQGIRLLARAAVEGAPAYVLAAGPERRARIFPDYAPWAKSLKLGDPLQVAREVSVPENTGASAPVAALQAEDGTVAVTLRNALAALKPNARVRLAHVNRAAGYASVVQPMLEVNCAPCHGGNRADSGISVASVERLQAGGRRGPALVPGKSAESLLYLVVSGGRGPHMPPDRDLTPAQLALLKRWIDDGARGEVKSKK